ncbi:secreted RxLR effector protein 161-like [Beta vulgaris subsp. vulgaris]|uniref:secreted RxLR effector protein 161-like n=1 Tax=Beta vulgaris subsp. vulgaris TaxID=3555 RepID=UPI002036E654|nr:secreted RxLR effector protein 161-like [Beta vulgaris subsp. vulgaris]
MGSYFKPSKELCPQSGEDERAMAHISYISGVRSVMYAMAREKVLGSFERLLRYLKGTSHVFLEFGQHANGAIGYCDLDYGGDLNDRKSTSDYVFTSGGTTVSWQSSLQDVVALSTTKVEFIVIIEAFKEEKWLKGLVGDISSYSNLRRCPSFVIATIHLAKNQNTFHKRTKHIDVKYNFL